MKTLCLCWISPTTREPVRGIFRTMSPRPDTLRLALFVAHAATVAGRPTWIEREGQPATREPDVPVPVISQAARCNWCNARASWVAGLFRFPEGIYHIACHTEQLATTAAVIKRWA